MLLMTKHDSHRYLKWRCSIAQWGQYMGPVTRRTLIGKLLVHHVDPKYIHMIVHVIYIYIHVYNTL